ncbi:hypothetical protein RN001_004001 [Aquatica leii]|uniref:peptide chain release factor N(5)-glutamine methyltransferase n=1 Tax=Aquatica leii TaxID=1421715 RepID=A0AAN7ST48_9COLE|nr:hypothetical protein RN001_004001 [Aquatica leii]
MNTISASSFKLLRYINLKLLMCNGKCEFHTFCGYQRQTFTSNSNSSLVNGKIGVSVNELFLKWKSTFIESDVSEPVESIQHILAHVLKTRNISIVHRQKNKILLPEEVERVTEYCQQRLKRVPIQYIIQEWDFRDLTLKMKPPVFIPRPETEMLVDIVLSEIDCKPINKILEFCCGSGAISIALLKSRPLLRAIALDKSIDACKLTETNAKLHCVLDRLKIINCDIRDNVQIGMEKYDVIVSNPPYVFEKDLYNLQPEIKLYEDCDAFNGGVDGLAVIKPILKASSLLLNYQGKLFMEVDSRHPLLITSWLQENKNNLKLNLVKTHKDFCSKDRFVKILKEY